MHSFLTTPGESIKGFETASLSFFLSPPLHCTSSTSSSPLPSWGDIHVHGLTSLLFYVHGTFVSSTPLTPGDASFTSQYNNLQQHQVANNTRPSAMRRCMESAVTAGWVTLAPAAGLGC